MKTIRKSVGERPGRFVGGVGLAVFVLLVVLMVLNQQAAPTKAYAIPTQTAFTSGISITPNKIAYTPNETVTMVVNGSGDITGIQVRIAPARLNIIQPPFDETITVPGTYNPATKSWSATNYHLPLNDGEYILMVNPSQSNGQFCAGNPAYPCANANCNTGTMAGSGLTAGVYACNGTHKTIVVDSTRGVKGSIDMLQYWNLAPGSYWVYSGTNEPASAIFHTRVAVEENVKIHGVGPLTPLRITKDNVAGYIRANKDINARIFLSYFRTDQMWSGDPNNPSIGRPLAIYYKMPGTANPLADLGSVYVAQGDGGRPPVSRSISTYKGNNSWMDFFNVYFAPYYFSKRWVNVGWKYKAVDILNSDLPGILDDAYWPYYYASPSSTLDYTSTERFIYNQIYQVQTGDLPSSYNSANAIRLTHFEAGYPLYTGKWSIREDWYFVKNIGRVKVDWKDCRGLPLNDPDCGDLNNISSTLGKMTDADVTMTLTNYYAGGALAITVATNTPPPSCTPKSGSWTLSADTAQGQPYTGYLEAKNCVGSNCTIPSGDGSKWGYGNGAYIWVKDGQAVVNMAQLSSTCYSGWRKAVFRPWIETSPADAVGESPEPKTQLPWSNSVTWYIN